MALDLVSRSRRGALATGLLLVGLLCLGLWRVISGSEHQAFAQGATPPESSAVTANHSYSLAVPGGVPALLKHGIPEVSGQNGTTLGLLCRWSVAGSAFQALSISVEAIGTKAETTVGHFDSPVTGNISVTCDGWGRMFIPDADTKSGDPSGYFLLLSILTLSLGGGLALSAGYTASMQRGSRRASDDE
jgi:hypothetical protein